jgi:hypothetical protein
MDGRVRAALAALFAFGCLGTGAELWLLEHNEQALQWVPLVLLGAGLATLAGALAARARVAVRAFQGVMLLFFVAGLAGTVLHHRVNLDFAREMDPEARGLALFFAAIHGATPALAPGTMIMLGAIGLLYAYRHPALGSPAGGPTPEEGT